MCMGVGGAGQRKELIPEVIRLARAHPMKASLFLAMTPQAGQLAEMTRLCHMHNMCSFFSPPASCQLHSLM